MKKYLILSSKSTFWILQFWGSDTPPHPRIRYFRKVPASSRTPCKRANMGCHYLRKCFEEWKHSVDWVNFASVLAFSVVLWTSLMFQIHFISKSLINAKKLFSFKLKTFSQGKLLYCNPPPGIDGVEFQDSERHELIIGSGHVSKQVSLNNQKTNSGTDLLPHSLTQWPTYSHTFFFFFILFYSTIH